jgi:hypothetical protein
MKTLMSFALLYAWEDNAKIRRIRYLAFTEQVRKNVNIKVDL